MDSVEVMCYGDRGDGVRKAVREISYNREIIIL